MKTTKSKTNDAPRAAKKMVLYARVSTEEQTRGNYPSCDSQVEELEAECLKRGWDAYRVIKDQGFSAGSLKRPGLTEMRWLVQNGEVHGVMCTWYDRLTRSRDFYTLDTEFQTHSVEFVTLHDPADTRTAAGRFMESMIVAAKTYERDQTSEKVSIKMRLRQEKGLHQGGLVPFGFTCDSETKMLHPDPEQAGRVEQIFRTYVDTRSDFAVRDWLQAHSILSPRGEAVWRVSTLRDLLSNRRYIGEIEINRKNQGLEEVPEGQAYRIVAAPHGPLIPKELWEMAQSARKEKALESPNRVGRPRSFSQTQCGRVYPLQGVLACGCCSHSMAPWYVHHKPGKHRRKESFVNYYICAQTLKGWKNTDHKNLILAHRAESWILDRISDLVTSPEIVEGALEYAQRKCHSELEPERDRLALNRAALERNQAEVDQMLASITSGRASGALLEMLNERAYELKMEREGLKAEQRRLTQALQPLESRLDAGAFNEMFSQFSEVAQGADPEKLQKLLRLMIRRIEWMPDGTHSIEYFGLPTDGKAKNWFYTVRRSDGPDRIRTGDLLLDRQACWASTPRVQI